MSLIQLTIVYPDEWCPLSRMHMEQVTFIVQVAYSVLDNM